MLYIRIAGITIAIDHRFPYVERLCKDYTVEATDSPDIFVRITDEEIQTEIGMAEFDATEEYAEAICVYRAICKQLPLKFQSFLMHCAVIEYEGKGYAFAAKSGTGKSTHIALWQKKFGSGVRIVNGDKPILRFCGEELYAYGTPWCGKEGFQTNTSVPLKAICFIERAKENSIRKISSDDAVMRVFHQVLAPEDIETVDALFPLLDRMLRQVPCYVLGCNISMEAAEVAYDGMNQNA